MKDRNDNYFKTEITDFSTFKVKSYSIPCSYQFLGWTHSTINWVPCVFRGQFKHPNASPGNREEWRSGAKTSKHESSCNENPLLNLFWFLLIWFVFSICSRC